MATIKMSDWETPEALELIQSWARNGTIDKDIAHRIGVSENTFCRWKKRSPAILGALKQSKPYADAKVESALFRSALGYSYTEVTRERDETGAMVVTKEVEKIVKPSTTAQIYWLKNRLPEIWRDHPELVSDVSGNPLLTSLVKLLGEEEKEKEE